MKNLPLALAFTALATTAAAAQSAPAAPKRAPVCAKAVRVLNDMKEATVPHDTVQVPPPDGPIRVSNEAEAEAAQLAIRTRAGSVGATAIFFTESEEDNGGGMITRRRSVLGIYARADSASAQKVCAEKSPG